MSSLYKELLKEASGINDKIIIDIFVEEDINEAHKKPKSKRRELVKTPCKRDIKISYPDKPDIEVHVRNRAESSDSIISHGPSVKVKPSSDRSKIPYVVDKNGNVTLADQYKNKAHAKDIEKRYPEIFEGISISAAEINDAWDLENDKFEETVNKIQSNIKDKISEKRGRIVT